MSTFEDWIARVESGAVVGVPGLLHASLEHRSALRAAFEAGAAFGGYTGSLSHDHELSAELRKCVRKGTCDTCQQVKDLSAHLVGVCGLMSDFYGCSDCAQGMRDGTV